MEPTMEIELEKSGPKSLLWEDELGNKYKFKQGVSVEVPTNVGSILLQKGKRNAPFFRRVRGERVPAASVELPTTKKPAMQMDHKVESQKETKLPQGEGKLDLSSLNDKRVLVVRGGGMGDVLFTTPVVRYIKTLAPRARVDFATIESLHCLMNKNAFINAVLSIKEAKAQKSRYDVVLNMAGGLAASEVAKTTHCVDALAKWVGIDAEIADKSLMLSPSRGTLVTGARLIKEAGFEKGVDKIIGIGVSASSRIRTWPQSYVRELVTDIVKEIIHVKVLLIGKHPEPGFFDGFPKDRVVSCINSTSIPQVIGIIKYMSLFIGSDSGLLWIAQALGVPAIGLFGAFNSEIRITKGGSVIPIDSDVACSPCAYHDSALCDFQNNEGEPECMVQIRPEKVLELIGGVMV